MLRRLLVPLMLAGALALPAPSAAAEPGTPSVPAAGVRLADRFEFTEGSLRRTGRTVRLLIPGDATLSSQAADGRTMRGRAAAIGLRFVPGGGVLQPTEVQVSVGSPARVVRILRPTVRVTRAGLVVKGSLPPPVRIRGAGDPPPGWYEGADGGLYMTAGTLQMMMDVPPCAPEYVNTFVTCMGSSFDFTFNNPMTATVNGRSTSVVRVSLVACMPYADTESQDPISLAISTNGGPPASTSLYQDCDSSMLIPYAMTGPGSVSATSSSPYTLFGSVFETGV